MKPNNFLTHHQTYLFTVFKMKIVTKGFKEFFKIYLIVEIRSV